HLRQRRSVLQLLTCAVVGHEVDRAARDRLLVHVAARRGRGVGLGPARRRRRRRACRLVRGALLTPSAQAERRGDTRDDEIPCDLHAPATEQRSCRQKVKGKLANRKQAGGAPGTWRGSTPIPRTSRNRKTPTT